MRPKRTLTVTVTPAMASTLATIGASFGMPAEQVAELFLFGASMPRCLSAEQVGTEALREMKFLIKVASKKGWSRGTHLTNCPAHCKSAKRGPCKCGGYYHLPQIQKQRHGIESANQKRAAAVTKGMEGRTERAGAPIMHFVERRPGAPGCKVRGARVTPFYRPLCGMRRTPDSGLPPWGTEDWDRVNCKRCLSDWQRLREMDKARDLQANVGKAAPREYSPAELAALDAVMAAMPSNEEVVHAQAA